MNKAHLYVEKVLSYVEEETREYLKFAASGIARKQVRGEDGEAKH